MIGSLWEPILTPTLLTMVPFLDAAWASRNGMTKVHLLCHFSVWTLCKSLNFTRPSRKRSWWSLSRKVTVELKNNRNRPPPSFHSFLTPGSWSWSCYQNRPVCILSLILRHQLVFVFVKTVTGNIFQKVRSIHLGNYSSPAPPAARQHIKQNEEY